jgi:DNA-binding NarL/FixJ family response regulator
MNVHIAIHRKMLLEGIHSFIDKSNYIVVTGISETLTDCRKALEKQPQPDVLLIDLSQVIQPNPYMLTMNRNNIPINGILFCEEVRKKYPDIKIVVLTCYNNWLTIRRMLDIGVSGYVLITSPLKEVLNAIDNAMDGEYIYLCPKCARILHREEIRQPFFWVTVREQIQLRLIAEGLANMSIAKKLFRSIETIKSNRKNLKAKFECSSTITMLKEATKMGLIWEDIVP